MAKKKDIKVEIKKVLNYNPKNFFNLIFCRKPVELKRRSLEVLNSMAKEEKTYPTEQMVKEKLIDLLCCMPALEEVMDEDKLKLTQKEMIEIIMCINKSLYFFFLYYYSKGFEHNFDVTEKYII